MARDSFDPRPRGTVLGVVVGAAAIVLFGAALGVAANHRSPRGIPLLPKEGEVRLPLPQGLVALGAAEAWEAYQAGAALFVDARPPEEFREEHVPGAVNLPPAEFEARLLDVIEQVETASAIIVYCSGEECSDAIHTAERLLEVRDPPLLVVEHGWREWKAAGWPTRGGEAP